MKRKFWVGASFSALVIAAMAPWSASQANGVSIRVNTPEFGIRIGAPHFPRPFFHPAPVYVPAPVYQPVPVYRPVPAYQPAYYPRHYRHVPPPVIYAPPPRYGWHGGYGYDRHRWQQRRWQEHRNQRDDRGDDDDRRRHWR